MTIIDLLAANLLSPVVLCFALGVVATLLKSDLELPDAFITALSIYLLLAIGLKGGVELSKVADKRALLGPVAVTLALGCAIPAWCYAILRYLGRFGVEDSAAMAAHYGSCSVVTFIAAISFLESMGRPAEGFLPALVAILEVPAIAVALLIAQTRMNTGSNWKEVAREVLAGRSVLLLVGGVVIGWAAGEDRYLRVELVFTHAFQGILCLFMLELGIKAASRLGDLKRVGVFLVAFAIVMPIFNGAVGAWLGHVAGLSVGGSMALGTLAASASYIAAPAAVRIALPTANPAYYLTSSLAITFPFNLSVGIPLYYAIAKALAP